MQFETSSSLKGHFIMAMPSLNDPNFAYTVTCISEHTADGAFGIIVNRIIEGLSANMIFDELGIKYSANTEKIPIHIGGPVHGNELFVLHGHPFSDDGLLRIDGSLALNNSRSIIEAIAQGTGPDKFIIALGCAGWGSGQLEWELKENAWLSVPCAPDIIFDVPIEDRWKMALNRLGVDPDLLASEAGNA